MTCHHMHLLPPHAPAATSQCLPTCSCAPANTQHPVSTPDTLDPQSSPFLAQGPESNMLMECGWTNRHGATSSSWCYAAQARRLAANACMQGTRL